MTRRRSSAFRDLLAFSVRLPPWLSLGLAAASYVLLRQVAAIEVPAPSGLDDMVAVVIRQFAVVFAQIGQYALPLMFMIGAVTSLVKRRHSRHLLNAFAVKGSLPDSSWSPSWREFEMIVAELYTRRGYVVWETSAGPDGGVDLVLCRRDERYLVQCKHWQTRMVGVKVVRELKGVIAQSEAHGGAVVTSGRFTAEAVEFADKAGVDLVDGQQLQALAMQVSNDGFEPTQMQTIPLARFPASGVADRRCPRCASPMVPRTARRGTNAGKQFLGCSRYPACKGTAPIGGVT